MLCFGFVFFIYISLNTLERTSLEQTKQNLKTFAHSVKQLLYSKNNVFFTEEDIPKDTINNTNDIYSRLITIDEFVKQLASHDPAFRITVISTDGIILGDSDAVDFSMLESLWDRDEVAAALKGEDFTSFHRSSYFDTTYIYYSIPIVHRDRTLILRLSIPKERTVFFSSSVKSDSIISAMIIMVAILIISFIIAGKILTPLTELEKTAIEYEKGNFSYLPEIVSPLEFRELATVFNKMGKTIEQNIKIISRNRDELSAIFSSITEALVVFKNDFKVLSMNDTAKIFFSVSEPIPKDATLASVIKNEKIYSFVKSVIKNSKKMQTEIEAVIFPPDESEDTGRRTARHVLVRCSKINDADNETRYLLVVTDISRLKRLEQVRKDFVGNVSHELKTPITAIKGFAETLLEGALEEPETAKHFLTIINQQSDRLINIVEDLLLLSRLEQANVPMEIQPTDLESLFADLFQAYNRNSDFKINLKQQIFPENEHILANLNARLFSQAICNLIDNCIKYCPENTTMEFITTLEKNKPDGKLRQYPMIHIIIQDDGPGIPDEYHKRIFERFFRVDKGRSRETGGTGLGLAIVKHIVELHKGTIKSTKRPDGKNGFCVEILIPTKKLKV